MRRTNKDDNPGRVIEMVIYDEYRYDACSITNDECCGGSCQECEVAILKKRTSKAGEAKADLERYTKFERNSNIAGVNVLVESGSVIAKTDKQSVEILQKKGLISKKTVAYHPDNLKQYSEHFRKLRRYNNLGIPDNIWGKKDSPAAFQFGDVFYLIAPKIESE